MTRDPWRRAREKNRRSPRTSSPETAELPLQSFLTSGRMLAWYALQQHDLTGRFLSDVLSEADARHNLSRQERGQAVDLVSGVVRRRRTIDTLLESQISRPRANVEAELWRLLQLGVYQVVFSRTPDHAAVDTIVELTKAASCPRWAGFANGVLRNVLRLMTGQMQSEVGADRVPIGDGSFLELNQPVFPNPDDNLGEYIGRAFSLPQSLATRWSARYSISDLLKVCSYSLRIPKMTLRVNRLVVSVDEVLQAFSEAEISADSAMNSSALRIENAARIAELPGYRQGHWTVQDESAMRASELLAPQPRESILDLCAAPGGKTTHLAELSGDNATVVACDVADHRLARIEESCERLNLTSVETVLVDRDGTDVPDGPFDAVLVDVPCSNTGVLARRPEARWRFSDEDLNELVQIQMKLLVSAFERVRPGGRIVYSTCSIEPEETSSLVATATASLPGLRLEKQQLFQPGEIGDGAFQALLRRDGDA